VSVPYYQALELAVRELLIEKGLFSAADAAREYDAMERRSPAAGGRVVARAWADAAFKARLLADGNAAIQELGFAFGPAPLRLRVLEQTREVHHLIVCTLCSCYPRMLLGLPPRWYKAEAYRRRAVREPRKVLAEFGVTPLPGQAVRVHDSTADLRYMVIPMRPAGTEGWPEEALARLVTRDSLLGAGAAAPVGPDFHPA
jgi:nitrile hydratase subunit alpha